MYSDEKPQIQILMCVYNGAAYIEDQLKSILVQTYENWELLISDDCSSDSSISIINRYVELDSRIRLVSSGVRYGSAKQNFLNLLTFADSSYVMFCDQDDVWDKNKVQITLETMIAREILLPASPVLIATDLRVVDSELNIISDSFLKMTSIKSTKTSLGYFMSSALVTGCTMMLNRPLVNLVVGASPSLDKIIMHDWWISLIAAAFGSVYYLNEPTISYRQHGDNSVGATRRSITKAILSLRAMHSHMLDTVVQVQEFKSLYNSFLTSEQLRMIDNYISLGSCGVFEIPFLLHRADAWRNDILGNLGMVIAFAWK